MYDIFTLSVSVIHNDRKGKILNYDAVELSRLRIGLTRKEKFS